MPLWSRSRRLTRLVLGAIVLIAASSCATGGTTTPSRSAVPSAASLSVASSYAEFAEAYCSAWSALIRAVGNPDIGDGSELSRAMDAAISGGDASSVDRLAASIHDGLEAGRDFVESASRWQPAAPMIAQLDRLFVAFEALVEAKRAAAGRGLAEAQRQGQDALIKTGGADAWFALIRPGQLDQTRKAIESARPASATHACPDVPYVSTP